MKLKLKKEVKVLICVLLLFVIGFAVIKVISNHKNEQNGNAPTIIENEGNVEIIIPEDQDSDGF